MRFGSKDGLAFDVEGYPISLIVRYSGSSCMSEGRRTRSSENASGAFRCLSKQGILLCGHHALLSVIQILIMKSWSLSIGSRVSLATKCWTMISAWTRGFAACCGTGQPYKIVNMVVKVSALVFNLPARKYLIRSMSLFFPLQLEFVSFKSRFSNFR